MWGHAITMNSWNVRSFYDMASIKIMWNRLYIDGEDVLPLITVLLMLESIWKNLLSIQLNYLILWYNVPYFGSCVSDFSKIFKYRFVHLGGDEVNTSKLNNLMALWLSWKACKILFYQPYVIFRLWSVIRSVEKLK